MSLLNFEHIEYFVEVCRHKSIAEAARHLFISQQALSRTILKLEEELGYELLRRTSRGTQLTEDGARFYDKFLPIVNDFQKAELQVSKKAGNEPRTTLRIAVAPGITRALFPEMLLEFNAYFPGLKLDIIEMPDREVEQYIQQDKRRFGLTATSEWFHKERHDYVFLSTDPIYLAVHKNNKLAKLQGVSLAVLEDELVLALSKNAYYQDILNRVVAPFGFSITPYFESTDVMDLLGMVNRGVGVVLCTKSVFDEAALNDCVLLPVFERSFDCCTAFVFQELSSLDAISREFIQFVRKFANKAEGAAQG
jgi:DNA-binding transcriptional LysR family regulator